MSYPWPSDLNRRSGPAAPALVGKCLHFEALESRILLSAEIGVPPSDPFADALLKDRYTTLESRDIDSPHLTAVTINQKLQSSIVSALERPQEKPHERTNKITRQVPLSWVMPDTTLLEANDRILQLTSTTGSDELPLGSDVDLTAKYGHADFFPDRPDKNGYMADVGSDDDLADLEERLLRSGRAWLTPLASDSWIDDRHHARSIEDLNARIGSNALQKPLPDRINIERISTTSELAEVIGEYTAADAQDFTTNKYGRADYIPDRPAKNIDVLPLGSDVDSTAKYGHADFFADRPDKNGYMADVGGDDDIADLEERLLRSGRAWLTPLASDSWIDDRHHARSIEYLNTRIGSNALQKPLPDKINVERISTTSELAEVVGEYTAVDAQDFTTNKYGRADYIPDRPAKNVATMPVGSDDDSSLLYERTEVVPAIFSTALSQSLNGAGGTVISQALIPPPGEDLTVVVGTAGSDIFENDSFSTTFQGLAGNDIYLFENDSGSDTIVEELDAGEDTLDFSAVTTPLMFTFNGDQSINVTGTGISVMEVTNVEILIGGQGDDTFTFLNDAQFFGTIVGGDGTDTLDYSSYGAGVTVDLGAGTAMDTTAPPEETLTVRGIENVTGSALADVLTGDSNNNTIMGGGGDDTIAGGAGDDNLFGGLGTDTVSYEDANAGVTVNLSTATAQDAGGTWADMLFEFENVTGSAYDDTLAGDDLGNILDGGDGVDTVSFEAALGPVNANLETGIATGDGLDSLLNFENITGSADNDILTGDTGDNLIIGGLGDDTLDGGAGGTDTVSYASAAEGVIVDLAAGTGVVDANGDGIADPGGEQDGLSNFDNVTGSNFNDIIAGNDQDNVLVGGGGIGTDTLSYANATGDVTVDLSITRQQSTVNAGDDTVSGFENLIGSAFDDTLSGDEGDNTLDGGAGGTDTISYANATGGIVAALGIAGQQDTMGAGDDTLLNFANLTGSAFDDLLTGDGFANVIDGGAGDDTLIGGSGNDDLMGGAGSDTVSYDSETGAISVNLVTGLAVIDGNADGFAAPPDEQDTLSEIENVIGGEGDDFITGDGQDNVIAGGRGTNVLDGGVGGTNTVSYAGADVGVTVNLGDPDPQDTFGEGTDTDTLSSFQNIIGSGYGADFGQGDTLTGTVGDNQFFVAAGADATIDGGPGPGTDSLLVDGRGLDLTGSTATSLTFDTNPATTATTITINDIEDVRVENASLIVDVELLRDGLQALANRFEELETAAAFVEAIPLADPLGATFGDLQNFGLVLQQLVDEFDDEFLSVLPVADPTSNEVVRFLSEWTDVDLEALVDGTDEDIGDDDSTWIANTLAASQQIIVNAAGNVSEIRFGHDFTTERSSQIDLSLSDTLRDADVAVARETFFDFLSGFQLDFTFGLTGLETGETPDFFVDEGMQLLSNASLLDDLPVDIVANTLIGFMGGTIDGPITTLAAAADGVFAASPDGIRTLLDDLGDEDSIGVENVASTIDSALDFVTAPGFTDAGLGDGLIDFANSDFLNLGTVLDLPGESADFGLIAPNELLRMLDQLGGWLATLAQSEILDMQVPFVGNTTVGDLLDYGEAFGEELLRFLVRHDGLSLSQELLQSGEIPTSARFQVAVDTVNGEETFNVLLNAAETAGNSGTADPSESLRLDVEDALAAAIGDPAISGELDVFLEGGRIGFRPVAGASLVSAVSMPMVGNETLGFDGRRLVVPTAILDSGVLGHDLEFTLNVGDDDERTIVVTPDSTNTSLEHLINDINAALRLPQNDLGDISVALDAGSTRELAFSVVEGSDIGAAILVGVRNPSALADGLSLGLEVANFASAQDLADKLSEILSGIVGGVTVDFDTVEREMSLTVNLSRDFDIAALPIDLSVDLGEFIELESSADLEVTANAGLSFTFGVDLEPSQSLVVAPPVSVPNLPDDGQLSDIATFDFTLFQQNFEAEERLSDDGDPGTVGALNVSGWTVDANAASTAVTWTAPDDMTPSDGRMVDGLLPDGNENLLPDQHFFIRVTDDVGVETLVDGVLQSFDTLNNSSAANLAEDLEGAMIVALASRGFAGLQVAITNVTDSGFDIAAAGAGFDNYQLELVTDDEFEVASVIDVSVLPDPMNNSSVSDLIEDVQSAIDNQSAMQLQRLDDTVLGLSQSERLIDGGDPVIGSVPVAENGVLERDVHFEVVIGGVTYRGMVAASATVDNEQENFDADDETIRQGDPVAALAADVEQAVNDAIPDTGATANVMVFVAAHPPMGTERMDLTTQVSSAQAGSPVIASGVLDQDVSFRLTVSGTVVSGTLAYPDTEDNLDAGDLATDIQSAINDALESAGLSPRITVSADANDILTFQLVAGADLEIDFSETPFRRLEYSVDGATIDELHFVTPTVLAEFTGNRVSLYAAPVLVQPVTGQDPVTGEDRTDSHGRLLARRIEISADAGDTAFTELGLLSSPIPANGQLSAEAEFVIIVDGNETTVTVYNDNNVANSNASNTSDNNNVEDLIADINVALATERGDANVQVRRVMFGDTTMSGGNRIEFFTADMSMIRSLTLPALQGSGDLLNPNAQDIAINELGFSPDDDHSARIQSGEFFVEDVALTGRLDILANDIEASAIVGFGGDGGLGLGVEVVESMGGVFGGAMIGLVNPDPMATPADATRISLGTLWEYISGDATQPLTDLVNASITGGVDIDLNVAPVLPIRTPIEPATVEIDLDIVDWLTQPRPAFTSIADSGLQVNVTGLDLNIYDALSNLTFSDVTGALLEVLDFLRDLQGQGEGNSGSLDSILDEPLPLLNQSPTELLVIADDFATLVDEVIANPSDSLDKLETMLEDLLGLPEELVTLGLDFDDGLALRVDLVFKAGVEESLGFDLNIEDLVGLTDPNSPARGLLEGITGLVGVSSTGDLSVGVGGTVRLSFGIELGSGNGSAEALGFRDGAMSQNGILTATSDAQAAAERLVDQDIEFILELDGTEYTVTVTAGETDDTVEVDESTLLSELRNAPELRAGPDIRVTLRNGQPPVDIDLGGPALPGPTVGDVVQAITNADPNLTATFDANAQLIRVTDASSGAGTEQSGVYVTLRNIGEGDGLRFWLQVGNDVTDRPVPVTVDAMPNATRKAWLAAIDEAIRQAMVDAGLINPVADAVVDVAYNRTIGQLTFQGTGAGFGDRLTIRQGVAFSIAQFDRNLDTSITNPTDVADVLGIGGTDSDGDGFIEGNELRTDDPANANGLDEDVEQAIRTALDEAGNPQVVNVELIPQTSGTGVGRLEINTDPNSTMIIREVGQFFDPFLYNGADGTAIILEAGASGENLEFTAQVGPFGFFVINGTANLDAFFQIVLDDTGDTPDRMMDGRTYFGQDDFEISTDYGGSASAELPLYFPTESRPVNEVDNTLDILVPDLLGFFNEDGGSVEITTPDLTAFPTPTLIGMLSNPEFIIDGLDSILASIQDALDGEIYGIDLPLIGDGLAPAGQFISDFREDVLTYLSLKLREGGLNPVTLVQETLYNIFADESDGDPAAVQVLGFEPGDDDQGTGTLQAGTRLTSGALARDAELNITVGDEDKTRVVVIADNIDGDTPEALVEAFNNALRGRGLDDSLTAGFVEDGNGGFFLTLDATNDESILIETAGAIQLDLFGLSVGGLDLLQDATGPDADNRTWVDINDIVKSGFGLFDEFGQFDFLLGQDYVFGQSLDFDLGLPILDFDLDAGIEIDFEWGLAFGFGVSQEDGFYFVAGDDNDPATPDLRPPNAMNDEELVISVDVNLLGALGFSPGRATGDDFDEDPDVMTSTGKLPSDGRLSGDVEFSLLVNGVLIPDIVVRANSTNDNGGDDALENLVEDINIALVAAGLDPNDVMARAELDSDRDATGRLQFVTSPGSTVAIYNSATAMGRLGFLVVEAVDGGREIVDPTDPSIYTGLTLTLAVDIADPGDGTSDDGRLTFSEISSSSTQLSDILSAEVTVDAMVNLGLTVNFGGLGIDASFLPAIGTDLFIDWDASFSTQTGSDIASPTVEMRDITLDLGSFISDFAGPYLEDIGAFLEPLGFLLDRQDGLLYKRLPVISDLAGETVTILQLAELLDREGKIVPFINAIEQIFFLTSLVTDAAAEADGGPILLEFGTVTLLGSELDGLESSGGTLADLDPTPTPPSLTVEEFNTMDSGTPNTQNFTRSVTRPGPGSVTFSILQPGTIVELLMGKPDVTLIEYDLPPFGFNFEYLQRFPIYPPLFATLRGFFSATVDLAFGYDTLGVNQFLASNNPLDLVNGFFVKDVDADGVDIPEVTLFGGIAAGASLDILIASAGVEGGIDATILFNLNDPDQDTKVRLSEMLGNILLNNFNPIAIFDTSGRVDAFLRAYIEVLFGLWSADYEIARVNLASFDIPFKRPPILASNIGDGVLQLNMGTASANRIHGSLTDGSESIIARYSNGSVFVSNGAGIEQRFIGIEKIIVDAGAGDDFIDLSGMASSGIAIEVHGGIGDDEIIGATDSKNIIFGGEGNDLITGGSRADELHGGDGDDEIMAGAGADLILGGAGADTIFAGAGDDDIEGGAGADIIFGDDPSALMGGNDIYRFSGNWGEDEVIENTDTAFGSADIWDFTGTTTDINFALGDDVRVGVVENVVVQSGALEITSTRHGLRTGDQIDVSGVQVMDLANGMATVLEGNATVTVASGDLDSFTINLPGMPLDLSYVAGTGIFQLDRSAFVIEGFSQADPDATMTGGDPLIQVQTQRRHGLQDGDIVFIGGTDATSGSTVLDPTAPTGYEIAVIDSTRFNLLGTTYTDPPFAFDDAFVQRDETGTGLVEDLSIDAAAGVITVTSTGHGLSDGDEIALFGSMIDVPVDIDGDMMPDDVTSLLNNRFTVTNTDNGNTFDITVGTMIATALDGVPPASINTGSAVWQLNRTHAESVGNSVITNGYGIETIFGGRGGDVFDIYQTDAQEIVLDGAGGSDTYRAHAVASRIGLGAQAVTKLFDTGNFWDTDVALFFGSESDDTLEVDNTNVITDIGSDDANPKFTYGEPNIVLGFQSGASATDQLVAMDPIESGELDRDARILLTIGVDADPILIVVEPDDVGGDRTVADLVDALNAAIRNSALNVIVENSDPVERIVLVEARIMTSTNDDGVDESRVVFDATDDTAIVAIENLSQGSGIEALEVEALGGDDWVDIGSTNSRTSVRVSGGLGNDHITVGGPADMNTSLITVNGIRGSALTGPLLIAGNEGTNTLFVSDAQDDRPNTGTLTDKVLSGLGMQINIEYLDMATVGVQLGSGDDTFTIQSTIDGETSVFAGAGVDTVDIETVSGVLNVYGEAGSDAITLQSSNVGSTANIFGGDAGDSIDVRTMYGNTNVLGQGGDDVIRVGSMAGLNDPGSVNLINGLLDISGGAGVDTLFVDDTEDGGLTLAAQSALTGTAAETGRLSGDARFELDFGDGSATEIVVVADIGTLSAASAVTGTVQADGILTSDAFFILMVGSERFDVRVERDTGNQSLADLLDDVNEALEFVGIDPARVLARLDGGTIVLDTLQGEDLSLEVEADNTAATELGFADNSDAIFDNNSVADLEADVNDALSAAGVAGQVSAAIDPDTGVLSFDLLSGDFLRIILDDGDAAKTELGLASGQLIQPNNVGTLRLNATMDRAELIGLGMGVPGDGLPGIVYDSIANVNISLGAGNDEFNVQGTLNDEAPAIQSLTTVDTGSGDDVINVSNTSPAVEADRGHLNGVLDAVQGELSILAGNGHNTMNVSDRESTVGDTNVVITNNRIEGLAPGAINYAATAGFTGGINIWAGSGADTVRFESTLADDVTTFYANDGDDQVTITDVDTSVADGLLVVEGGLGGDLIDGSTWNSTLYLFGDLGEVEYQDRTRAIDQVISVSTIIIDDGGADQLFGGSANDVLLGGIDSDSVSGGQGDDAVIGDGGRVTFDNGEVVQIETTDFFIGGGDMLAGGQMNSDSQAGGDGNDVIIGGAGLDILFGTLAEDILIYEYGRVTYQDGLATTVVVLGQRPLDLAAGTMFDLYLKDRFLVSPYFVGEVASDRTPIEVSVIDVSTGPTLYSNAFHDARCQKYLAEVGFELNSAILTSESHVYLRQAADYLSNLGGVLVQINGHADSIGASVANQRLSLDRAQSVVDALVEYGVNPAILRAAGYGEERPVGDNATEQGRAVNRRVEIEVDDDGACRAPVAEANEGGFGLGLLALAGWRSTRPTQHQHTARRINW